MECATTPLPNVSAAWPMGRTEGDYFSNEAYSQQPPPATPRGWEHQIPGAQECPDAPLRKPLAHPRKGSRDVARSLFSLEPAALAYEAQVALGMDARMGG